MADKDLSPSQRRALLTLLALNSEVSNPDLDRIAGFRLVGKDRVTLTDQKLVRGRMVGQAYHHELTDDGFTWCVQELSANPPGRSAVSGTLYAFLGLVHRFLRNRPMDLLEFCQVAGRAIEEKPEPDDIETQIRRAYRKLAKPGFSVRLARVRQELPTVSRDELDRTLRRMAKLDGVQIEPEANQTVLTQADRDAAIKIGGEDSHVIVIEGS